MNRELTRWDKLPSFSSFQEDMNRMPDNFFRRETSLGMGWSPNIDIAE